MQSPQHAVEPISREDGLSRRLRVDLRCDEAFVAQEFLDAADVGATKTLGIAAWVYGSRKI